MSTQSDIALIRGILDGIDKNRVAKFAYTDVALANDIVAGVDTFDVNAEQNVPKETKTDYNDKVLTKGIRSQGASYPRMAQNHFFGRVSYNLNKLAQKFLEFLDINAATIAHNAAEYDPNAKYKPGDTCYVIAGTSPLITYTLYQRISPTPDTITGIAPTDTNHWKDAVYKTGGAHKRYAIADLTSGYDSSTWYPVTTDLQAFEALIGAAKDPALQVSIEAFCNGTVNGFANAQRAELAVISKFTGFAASSTDIVVSDSVIDQVTGVDNTASPAAPIGYSKLPLGRQAVIWLKGGSKYALWNSFGASFTLHTAAYNNGLDAAIAPVGVLPFTPLNGTVRADVIGKLNGVTPGSEGLYLLGLTSLLGDMPEMDGTGSAGASNVPARADHQHPSDTSKANLASPEFTGTPTAPSPTLGDETQQLATAEFVKRSINYYAPAYAADGNVGYNFVNRQFEVSLSGWSAYKNTPGTPAEYPVDGTGGTPVAIALSRITGADALVGNGSARLTKSAVNGQGEGISYDFTIDTGCLGATAQIFLLYRTSANYVGGDVGVFIYDITNARLIPCSLVSMPATDTDVGSVFTTQFVPSNNSNAYRLIFNVQSQSTAGWTFDIDNIQVGQKQYMMGAAVTSWVDYPAGVYPGNVTITAGKCPISGTGSNPGKGTVVEDHAQWARSGEDMLVKFDYKQSSAGTAGNGAYLFALPLGNTINLEKYPIGSVVGEFIASTSTDETQESTNTGVVVVQSANSLGLKYRSIKNGILEVLINISSMGRSLASAIVCYRFSARFSCAQFSVNSVFNGVNEPFYLSNTETAVNTNGAATKTKIGIDGAPILANTVATYYDMTLPRALLPNETLDVQLRSKIDGNWFPLDLASVPSRNIKRLRYDDGYTYLGNLSRVIGGISASKVAAGQVRIQFEAACIDYTGSNVSWATMLSASDCFNAWRVRIGQAADGNEVKPTVFAYYTGGVAGTPWNYPTKVADTHDAVTVGTGAWKFRAPYRGIYEVTLHAFMSTSQSNAYYMYVYKNGVQYGDEALFGHSTSTASWFYRTCTVKVVLEKGDYIDIRGNYSGSNFIQVLLVGIL